MRKLIDTPNIEAATTDYPKGRVKDRSGAIPGTTLTELGIGDLIQLFQKLVIDASITENDLPDNVTNGYQLLEALLDKITDSTKIDPTIIEDRAGGSFDTGTITIAAESFDRMIYAQSQGTITGQYGVIITVGGIAISRIDGYQAISYLLPKGVVSVLTYGSGTCNSFTIHSHKIGL